MHNCHKLDKNDRTNSPGFSLTSNNYRGTNLCANDKFNLKILNKKYKRRAFCS